MSEYDGENAAMAGTKERTRPEEKTQAEVREQAQLAPDDQDTSREELELDLMEADESERGEKLG